MTKKPVILCVDDEWNGLEVHRMLFEERGYNVLVATSGYEALQLFASHPTDLVLLDYHMPRVNGDVIARRMKASQPDIPIAMLSADEGLPESALESVDAFISKSESPASLLERSSNTCWMCVFYLRLSMVLRLEGSKDVLRKIWNSTDVFLNRHNALCGEQ
jgi:CheY-like chemotaxis protein